MAGWSAAGAVAAMDLAGVAAGIAYPGAILEGSDDERRTTARLWNTFGAKIAQDHPGRFGLFASLPFPNIAACVAEIDYAFEHLQVDGFGIATNYDQRWLGDESFWPIYEKLNIHNAVVFVHPQDASCCTPQKMSYMAPNLNGSWIEWPVDTARTILSLMASGTLRRFPGIRFIFAHGGGVMPLLIGRIQGFAALPKVGPEGLKRLFPEGIDVEFAKLHFECAQSFAPTNMNALRSLVPDSQILFGSDYPLFPLSTEVEQFDRLGLPPGTRRAITRGNAAALLPRWA